MAWIELHQSLPGHRKTMRLRRALRIGQAQAIGHLCMLWLWCLDNCPDGNMSALMDCDIAEAAGYEKRPEDFTAALREAGFLDEQNQVHDWFSYAGKLIEKREQNAHRMRERRARADNVQRTCSARVEHVHDLCTATVPNRTQPYPTVPNRTVDTTPIVPAKEPDSVATAPDLPPSPPKPPSAIDRRFEEFWTFYPKKIGKGAAAKSYAKIRADDALHKTILAAIVKAKRSRQWTEDGGQYIPNPATWLNQKRWEDEPDTAERSQGSGPNHRQGYPDDAGRRTGPSGGAGDRYKPDPSEVERIARERGVLQ